MSAFILRRLLQAIVVMLAVALIAFMLFQHVGDPVVFLLGQDARPDQIRQLRTDLGLDQPFFVQFWHFSLNAVQGEFGLSLRQGAKVSRLIAERLPATLELALVAALLALVIGVPLGVSLPIFLIGVLLLLVFAIERVVVCM
jgi:peptide/nickel transport system permease protein